jgi:hypothetical protein
MKRLMVRKSTGSQWYGFAMVRAGSEPARTVKQLKGMEALNRRMLRENST